jgi:hypothetical protein
MSAMMRTAQLASSQQPPSLTSNVTMPFAFVQPARLSPEQVQSVAVQAVPRSTSTYALGIAFPPKLATKTLSVMYGSPPVSTGTPMMRGDAIRSPGKTTQ